MNSHIRYAIILLIIIFGSCTAKMKLKKADKAFNIGEYTKAIDRYKAINKDIKEKQLKRDIAFNLAESYRRLGEYQRSQIWYRNALRRNHPNKFVALYYADALKASGKLADAVDVYQAVLDSMPENIWAQNGITSCKMIPKWQTETSRFRVNNERQLNSKASDYGISYAGKESEVVISSTRDLAVGKGKNNITGEKYSDLFVSEYLLQNQKWATPDVADDGGGVNTENEEGACSITQSGQVMYFTYCGFEGNKVNTAQILQSIRKGGAWDSPTKVELFGDSIMAAHPAISPDGTVLYFVSDKPGGYGGKDIWRATKKGSKWENIENLGKEINTPGDELFPTARSNDEIYFSSNFHPGMGGLDIYHAKLNTENNTWKRDHFGAPINSTSDDFGLTFYKDGTKGFFISNRKGSRSDDIYSFVLPPKVFQVLGEVYNKETDIKEKDATIRIIGTDGTYLKMKSKDGRFRLELNEGVEYIFAAFKDGFLNAKATANTIDLDDSKDFPVKLQITPTDAPIKVDNINYQFGKWDLLRRSKNALDSLVTILEDNPTIVIELMSHTDFIGSDKFNLDLSQKRARAVVDYLIARGIASERLVAKGYGETWPKKITRKMARKYSFLKKGDELTETFINRIKNEEQQEICKQINRRTEFRVLSTDYQEKYTPELEE